MKHASAPFLFSCFAAFAVLLNDSRAQDLYVGSNTPSNTLEITNGTNSYRSTFIGSSSTNNYLVVRNSGTLLTNTNFLFVGDYGSGNRLLISNGGKVSSLQGIIGGASLGRSNIATVTGAGSLWTNSDALIVGKYGSGNQLVVSNGGTVAGAGGSVGDQSAASNNIATVTGAGSLWTNSGSFFVGKYGSGNQLVVSSEGTAANVNGYVGYSSSSSIATVTGAGSLWKNSGDFYLGRDGISNRLVISNGGVLAAAYGYVGYQSTASNNIGTVTGAGSLWTNSVALSMYGVGNRLLVSSEGKLASGNFTFFGGGNTLTVSNAGVVASSWVDIGNASTASNNTATVTGAGSVWTNSGYFAVGGFGSGNTLTVSNAGVVASSWVDIGNGSTASNNAATVTGAGSLWTNSGDFYVGRNASANQLTVSNGGVVTSAYGYVGESGDANIVTVTGAGSLWTNSGDLHVGYYGDRNRLVISNGATVAAVSSYLGYGYVASSEYGLSNTATVTGADALWTNSGFLTVGRSGPNSSLTVADGGTVVATGIVLADFYNSSATLNIGSFGNNDSGGTILAPTIAFGSGTGVINFNQSNAIAITSVISGNGTLNQLGSGRTTLTSANTYTGGTTISAGVLALRDDGSLSEATAINLSASGAVFDIAEISATGSTNGSLTGVAGSAVNLGSKSLTVGGDNSSTTFAGVISNSGSLTKVGTGTMVLSGLNTYGGVTAVGGGTLRVIELAQAGTSSSVGTNATIVLTDGGVLDYAGTADTSMDRGIDLAAGMGGIGVSNSAVALTFYGVISNSGSLTKSGAGTLILAVENSFSGGFTLSSGAVRAQSGGAFGSGSVTQTDGTSRLIIDTTQTVTNQMSIFHLQSWQTVTLSGAKILNNATYDVTNDTTTTESGNLSGSGGVTKLGAGTLILSGSNSYTGAVSVQSGLLDLASTAGQAAGGASSVMVATNATLLISQSNQVNDSAGVTLSGGTIRRGSGVSEIFGNLNITAASTLDFGLGAGGSFQFQNYSNTGSALVTVQNFLPGNSMQFLTNSFSTVNLNQFAFGGPGFSTSIQGNYFTITAIPESSTFLAAVGLLGLLTWSACRRGRSWEITRNDP